MPRNTSVSLGDHFTQFIDAKVREGRYGSASDAIRAGLRLLEAEEAKLDSLRAEIAKGEASGPPRPIDWDAWLEARHAEWTARKA